MRLGGENRWVRVVYRYLVGLAVTAAAVWLRLLLIPLVGPTSPYLTVYPAVMFVAFFLGTGPGIAAGLLGIWLVELHVIDPDGTQPSEMADWLRASIVLFSAAFLGYAGHRVQAAYRRIFNLLESISDAFVSVDANWRFAYANGEAERLLGQSRDALLGKPLWEAYPGAAGETLRPRLEQAVGERKPSRFEVFHPATGAWHEMHARPTRDGLWLYFRDVTDRKQAEQALRQSEEKYRSLFETIDEGFCIIEVLFDEQDRARDYRFLEVNPAFEKQTGLADAVGRTIRELAPDHEQYWFEIYGRIARTGVPERFENQAQALSRFYDVYAFRLGAAEQRLVAVLFTDITERKRREANLAFLAQVTEDLTRLTSADEIAQQLGAKIGAYLQVESCSFSEVDDSRDELTILFGWQQAGTPSPPGTIRMSEYYGDEFQAAGRRRQTIAVGDTQSDPRTQARPFADLNIRSLLSAPFLKQGRWKYSLMGTSSRPRRWRPDELELFQELASRIFPRIERALAEEAQRQAVELCERQIRLFEGIASTTPDFVYVFDPQGRFQYVNRRLLEVWGLTLPEALGKTCRELGYEQWHHDMHMREIAEVIATKRPISGEVPFRAPRTGVFGIYEYIFTPVLGPDGEVELIAGTTRDVTDRRRADDAARELQRKLDSALLAGEVATFEWRVPEDRLWGDQNFARLFGLQMDSGGAPLAEYLEAIHPDDRAHVTEQVNRTVTSGCPYEVEYRVVSGGQTRWVVARGTGERDETGRVVRFPGVIVDITDRRLAESALQESENRLRFVVEHSPDNIFIQDRDLRYVWVSRPRLPLTADQYLGRTDDDILAPEEATRLSEIKRRVIAEGRGTTLEVPLTIAGEPRHFEAALEPWRDAGGSVIGLAGYVREITERKQTEETLRAQQELLTTVIDNIPVMLSIWDARLQNFRFNRHLREALGWDEQDAANGNFMAKVYPDPEYRQSVIEYMQSLEGGWRDLKTTTKSGAVLDCYWANVRLSDETSIGIGIDISERKRSEEALRQSEARYRESQRRFQEVLENSLDAAYRRDLRTDTYDYVSPVVRQVFNIDPDVLAAMPVAGLLERIHPDDRETVGRAIQEGTAAGSGRVEYRFRGDDGQYRWLADHFTVQRDAAGQPISRGGIVREITELRKVQEALKEADRRKDEFLAMLGHELRNPLAAITTGLRLLRAADAPRQAWVQESLERQTRQLVRLVDDLLDVSRITRGKIQLQPEYVDLRHAVERAAESTADLVAQKRHTFTIRGPEEPLGVFGDATRLQQVIANLLNNAAKYTDEGGRIELSLAREQESAVIRVTDNGAGIPPELQQSIFELFGQVDSTLHSSQQGLGIGLHLVKTLVELHGGSVHVHSAGRGAGCEFTVRLPLAEPPDEIDAEHRPAPASEPRLEILLVEDNKEAARLLGTELTDRGHRVRLASDGRAALELARVQQPDLIILDIGLPDISGYEVARKLREDQGRRDILIVAASGYGQERDRQRSRAAGIDYHLVKPLEYDTLASLVREWLRTAYDRRREIARRSQSQRHTARPPAARILIIDDTAIIAEMTQEVLQSAGHEVQVAFDGCSGLQTAREFRPNLILCDISMPGMNGYEVVRALIEDGGCQGTTFVAVSGYGDEAAQQRSREAGFHAHLVKPVSVEALQELIRGLPAASPSEPAPD